MTRFRQFLAESSIALSVYHNGVEKTIEELITVLKQEKDAESRKWLKALQETFRKMQKGKR